MAYKKTKYRSPDPITPECNKKIYNSLEEAEDMIRHIRETRYVKELHAYKCLDCGMWHLSSNVR